MTIMRVAVHSGQVLTYDTDDVQDIHISTPGDIRDATPPFANSIHRELTGDYHLHLHIDFKHGKKALWVDQAEAMLPDLRMGGELLTAALDAEDVPPEVASRVWNRFFFTAPDGPDAVYRFDHDPADCPGRVEVTRMADAEPQWMHGKTCTEAARRTTHGLEAGLDQAAAPHPFASLIQVMEAASHVADPIARDVRAFAADGTPGNEEWTRVLADGSVTLEGTFNSGPSGLRDLMADAPTTRDLLLTPKPEDRKPCPHCHQLADQMQYEDAEVRHRFTRSGTVETASFHVSQVRSARFLPCGHRFDGATGALIEGDDD